MNKGQGELTHLLDFTDRLKLKTILSLVPDEPDEVFQDFCREQGIRPIHLSVDKVKDNVPLTYNRAVEAVQVC
jgi:tyrosine-protein phosphatase OCA6